MGKCKKLSESTGQGDGTESYFPPWLSLQMENKEACSVSYGLLGAESPSRSVTIHQPTKGCNWTHRLVTLTPGGFCFVLLKVSLFVHVYHRVLRQAVG